MQSLSRTSQSRISPSRRVAFQVLCRVAEGAYASDLLVSAAEPLSTRDAGLASEIILGCLRVQSQLDYLIQHYSGKTASKLDLEVLVALRMAVYQSRYLDRIPRHAAVTESVELVRAARRHAAVGFTNAVLRKVDRRPILWPDRARELATPEWLLARWDRQYGAAASNAIAQAFLFPPEAYIRVPAGAALPEGVGTAPTDVPGCLRLLSGDPSPLRLQDISSQTIVPLLGLQPGQRFLDLCSAPGNKTAQALETPLRAVACDLHLHRLRTVPQQGCTRIVLDGTHPLPFRHTFDRVLVDAPCSGTGTLGRNPEAKWRIQPHDLSDLAGRQRLLLGNALTVLQPGGRLVYSTCSLEREEGEDVVQRTVVETPGLALASETRRIPGRDKGDGFYAAVLEKA